MRSLQRLTVFLALLATVLGEARQFEQAAVSEPTHVARAPLLTACPGPCSEVCEAAAATAPSPVFSTETPCLQASVELAPVTGRHVLRFQYYDPRAELYFASAEGWSFPKDGGRYARVRVTHRLAVLGEEAALRPGNWRLVVTLDGVSLTDTPFVLEVPALDLDLEARLIEPRSLLANAKATEAAAQFLTLAQSSTTEPRLAAEAWWWRALALQQVGDQGQVLAAIRSLLEVSPNYAVSPAARAHSGGAELEGLLDELRAEAHPGGLARTELEPRAELMAGEPLLPPKRPSQKWKKILLYGGIAVVVGTVIVLLTKGDKLDSPPQPTPTPPRPPRTPTPIPSATGTAQFSATPTRTGGATATHTPTRRPATPTPTQGGATATPAATTTPTESGTPSGDTPTMTRTPTSGAGETPTETPSPVQAPTDTPTLPPTATPTTP